MVVKASTQTGIMGSQPAIGKENEKANQMAKGATMVPQGSKLTSFIKALARNNAKPTQDSQQHSLQSSQTTLNLKSK